MHSLVSVNGRLTAAADATISPLDRGFTLGDGIFETLRVTEGVAWYLDRHLARLNDGAARLGIPIPQELLQWTTEIVAATLDDASGDGMNGFVLRITLSRGVASRHGIAVERDVPPTVVLATLPLPVVPADLANRGIRAQLSPFRRDPRARTTGVKTTNYLDSILALQDAVTAGFDDSVCLDTRGFVAEASASNLFIWAGEKLVTPTLGCGIIPGITRAIVLEIAGRLGDRVVEREFMLDALTGADEAFLTSSVRGIVPLISVDAHRIGNGTPGARTARLIAAYASADREGGRPKSR